MFVNHEILGSDLQPKIVIIGAGPAGLTLAEKLAQFQIPTLLLEGGDEFFSNESQDIYSGSVVGSDYYDLDYCRLRHFGGSGNHWGGWSRPLDARDFEDRDDLGIAGWPIPHSEIDQYASDTFALLDVDQTKTVSISSDLDEVSFSFSDILFGQKYAPIVKASEFMHVLLNASVTSLRSESGRISTITVEGFDGTRREINADRVILACGGIENSRLLLWSNIVSSEPVVPDARTLGRYWMEHPLPLVGQSYTRRHYSQIWNDTFDGFPRPHHEAFFILSSEAARKYGSLNARIRIAPSIGRQSMMKYRTKLAACEVIGPGNLTGECLRTVKVEIEQEPRLENRIELSPDDRDSFGNPRSVLYFDMSELDYHTGKVASELVGRHLLEEDLGMMRLFPGVIDGSGFGWDGHPFGHHHMGGTRMSNEPSEGIVDKNLKVHGISNAYVLGSSVYPRGGQANPTSTILQLALRLADHLRQQA